MAGGIGDLGELLQIDSGSFSAAACKNKADRHPARGATRRTSRSKAECREACLRLMFAFELGALDTLILFHLLSRGFRFAWAGKTAHAASLISSLETSRHHKNRTRGQLAAVWSAKSCQPLAPDFRLAINRSMEDGRVHKRRYGRWK